VHLVDIGTTPLFPSYTECLIETNTLVTTLDKKKVISQVALCFHLQRTLRNEVIIEIGVPWDHYLYPAQDRRFYFVMHFLIRELSSKAENIIHVIHMSRTFYLKYCGIR
jgi:hypothetical protein